MPLDEFTRRLAAELEAEAMVRLARERPPGAEADESGEKPFGRPEPDADQNGRIIPHVVVSAEGKSVTITHELTPHMLESLEDAHAMGEIELVHAENRTSEGTMADKLVVEIVPKATAIVAEGKTVHSHLGVHRAGEAITLDEDEIARLKRLGFAVDVTEQ